jgi:hypothetical protein
VLAWCELDVAASLETHGWLQWRLRSMLMSDDDGDYAGLWGIGYPTPLD